MTPEWLSGLQHQVEGVPVDGASQAPGREYLQDQNCSKRLAAILKLAFEVIPHDPANTTYQQGGTLGRAYTHWQRAKFFKQYRL